MKNTHADISALERITRINFRLAKKGLELLGTEQRAILSLDTTRTRLPDTLQRVSGEMQGLFDDLRDRCGVDCDDLWPLFRGSDELAHAIAANFASQMRAFLGPTQVQAVADLNAVEENTNICHSHDFCDANELMAAAFRAECGRDIELPSSARAKQAEADCALWNHAFALVRFYCSRIGHALALAGFTCQHQGGGLYNWRIDLKNGIEVFACGEDGAMPNDTDGVTVGLTFAASTLCETEYAIGAGLADVLNEAREGSK